MVGPDGPGTTASQERSTPVDARDRVDAPEALDGPDAPDAPDRHDRDDPPARRRPPAPRISPEALAAVRGGAVEGLAWLGRTPESSASRLYRLVRLVARFVL
ncbi:MAG: hypothetical protein ACXW4H_07415, partial [Candidatus Limnocylindrales bacterium]